MKQIEAINKVKKELGIYFLLWANAFHPEFFVEFAEWRESASLDDYLARCNPYTFIRSAFPWKLHTCMDWHRVDCDWREEVNAIILAENPGSPMAPGKNSYIIN